MSSRRNPLEEIPQAFSSMTLGAGVVQENKLVQETNEGDPSSLTACLQSYIKSRADEAEALALEREHEIKQLSLPKKLFNKEKVSRSILAQCKELPIYSRKEELLELVRNNQFVIVLGETGSGKSTQIPQYLAEAGLHGYGKIGVTQPRRIAAISLADRVAKECGVTVGDQVGHAVRFDNKVSSETVIKYMTDGMLVKECASESNLEKYSIIIIDEAHERSIHTDVCFGLLKRAAKRRPDLKVIISSATLQEEKFSKYFTLPGGQNAPILNVSGRSHDVELVYRSVSDYDLFANAVDLIIAINMSERRGSKGDILVFLAGQDEIEKVGDMLEIKWASMASLIYNDILILPIHGSLQMEKQQEIYNETPKFWRKVILATNIAETSITVNGVVHVIDCGYYKQTEYNPRSGVTSLIRKRITKFQAIQRKGRAGRTQAGKCYRMYSEFDYNCMKESSDPEITRCNVESVILDIIAMGIADPLTFDFMDPLNHISCLEALLHLKELEALGENNTLTNLGRRMSAFPLDPALAKVVLESQRLGCSDDVVKIVGILSTNYINLFYRNKGDKQKGDEARTRFKDANGDLIALLNIYNAWERYGNKEEQWCKMNAIQYQILLEASEIQSQLKGILHSCGVPHGYRHPIMSTTKNENIRRAFTAGYFRQLAKKKLTGHAYMKLGKIDSQRWELDEDLFVHPSSCTFSSKHPWIIYHEVTKTSKAFMNGITPINVEWIDEYAPKFAATLRQGGHLA